MTTSSTLPVPDDRDLLAGEPVDALVASVYAELAELEERVRWAEHRAEVAEGNLRRALERNVRHPHRSGSVRAATDRCATTARAHLANAVSASALQADAIVVEARAQADDLLARARHHRPARPLERPAAVPPASAVSAAVPHVPSAAAPPSVLPQPAGDTTGDTTCDTAFDLFWAESERAADTPKVLQQDGFARGLASTMAVVLVLLVLLLQLT